MIAAINFGKFVLAENWEGRNSRGRKEEESTAKLIRAILPESSLI